MRIRFHYCKRLLSYDAGNCEDLQIMKLVMMMLLQEVDKPWSDIEYILTRLK